MSDSTDTDSNALVVFTPSGKRGRFAPGTPVLQAARKLGVDLDSVCGGRGICGRCQLLCAEGEFPKHGLTSSSDNLTPYGAVEERYERIKGAMANGRRLGCQAQIHGDVVIDIPADSQVHKQVIRKAADHVNIPLDPAVRLHYVEVTKPDMHDPSGDLRRLRQALQQEWQLSELGYDKALLPGLQTALRSGDWKVTVAVHSGKQIIGVWPGYYDNACGVAIDVGSTTIAAHLCSLADGTVLASSGAMNPQIRFGEDLMSRVSYVMMNPGGDVEMTDAVREAINTLLVNVCEQATAEREAEASAARDSAEKNATSGAATEADVDAGDDAASAAMDASAAITINDILEITFVANPVMHHLLLGIDPIELGGAPFALAIDESISMPASEMAIEAHPGARVYVLPCVAGHVGADTAGVMLAEQPDQLDPITLLVDVGTNAEIVLGNRDRLLACSSPTGPAFEGAQISGGQRAAPGAIERVRIDRDSLEPRFTVIGCETWSDDAAFAEDARGVGVTGICGSGIIEVVAEMFLAGIINTDGVIDGSLASRSTRVVEDGRTFSYLLHQAEGEDGLRILITQNDVRQIQLAKAALYAGVRLLMDRLGIEQVERIRLAGAFGSHIDVKYAMVLGLIPDCSLDQVNSAGNAAGNGARIALLNQPSRQGIENLVQRVEKIETAVEPRFQEHFVDAMAFPHKTAPFPQLAQVVTLPQPSSGAGTGGGADGQRPRRRRRKKAS